jgi:GcrA cell cycle regulator
MSWTDERVELLKKLWSDGLSASQIAAELGSVTRNAVIGKVHRLGLSGRAKAPQQQGTRQHRTPQASPPPSQTHVQQRAQPRGGMTAAVRGNTALAPQFVVETRAVAQLDTRPESEVVIPMSRRVQIMELREAMCRWPMGDPTHEDFVFCGNDCDLGKPYCSHHAKIAFQPSAERRRDR